VVAADGVDVVGVKRIGDALRQRGAIVEVLAPVAGGTLAGGQGGELAVDRAINTTASVLYDAVVVPCGPKSVAALSTDGYAVHFVTEAYKHLKAVGVFGSGLDLVRKTGIEEQLATGADVVDSAGLISTTAAADTLPDAFCEFFGSALAKHRAWDRETDMVPA
jgi:catalase